MHLIYYIITFMVTRELVLQPKIVTWMMEMVVEHSLPLEIHVQESIKHYCPLGCCNPGNAWKTASGAPMVFGRTVAASAREFPFGTRLLINGQIYVVEDRGVPRGTIDILTPTHVEALDRGKFYTTVHVWKED